MPIAGLIYALDLATRTGFCKGRPGAPPVSGAVLLKNKGEHRAVALGNLIAFLQREWSAERPSLVVTEGPLTLQAFLELHSSQDNVRMHYALHGVVEAMTARFGSPLHEANMNTVRKHFLGRARFGSRALTKAAVVERAQLLKLMPLDADDEDRADAVATWDWAAATYGRASVSTRELFLFNEQARGN